MHTVATTDNATAHFGGIAVAASQVLMECKDAEGVQKFVAVPANISWTDLLLKLKNKYGRSVIFMYEADGHTYTVKDKGDLKQCWDSVEEAFLKTNPVTPSGHLVAFIINLDPSKLSATGRTGGFRTGGKSHLAPKRVNLGQVRALTARALDPNRADTLRSGKGRRPRAH